MSLPARFPGPGVLSILESASCRGKPPMPDFPQSALRPIVPVTGPVTGSIRPPGSKSLTNRALVLAALARGESRLTGVLHSVDTHVMLEALTTLGISITENSSGQALTIVGCEGLLPSPGAELHLENSGTSIRFLTAMVSLGNSRFTLDGNARMQERPIIDLVDALAQLGVAIECPGGTGCPPVQVDASGLAGGRATLGGSVSSQYLSALLMAAACAADPVTLCIDGPLVSRPYIDMTLGLMTQLGADVRESPPGTFTVLPTGYEAAEIAIEPDASAASYFLAAAAVTSGRVTIDGLRRDALQGDVAFVDCLVRMGCRFDDSPEGLTLTGGPLQGIDVDMNAISDTAQTLAVVAAFAESPTRIRGIAHARHKETDRVSAMVTELRKLGLVVDEHEDGLTVHPGPLQPGVVETYDDHRMAMSFAVAGLRTEGLAIADPGCTSKTYPDFFEDLDRLCRVNQ